MKTLTEYAKENRIHYRTAWNAYKADKIPGAFKSEYGKILIPNDTSKTQYVVCYARVSSSTNRNNLEAQATRLCNYCAAKGYVVQQVIKECASGLNDKRPKLIKLLCNPKVTVIIVEHQDRLTHFGFNYIRLWAETKGCEIKVINEVVNDKEDLMQDFVSLVTSFVARLYGLRCSKRKTEQLIKTLGENENNEII